MGVIIFDYPRCKSMKTQLSIQSRILYFGAPVWLKEERRKEERARGEGEERDGQGREGGRVCEREGRERGKEVKLIHTLHQYL